MWISHIAGELISLELKSESNESIQTKRKYSKQGEKEENKVLLTFCDTACKQCPIIHTAFLTDRHNCGELLFQRYLIWQTNT